nr:uncharacterized protein LOC106677929 [Halyomorpha halys]
MDLKRILGQICFLVIIRRSTGKLLDGQAVLPSAKGWTAEEENKEQQFSKDGLPSTRGNTRPTVNIGTVYQTQAHISTNKLTLEHANSQNDRRHTRSNRGIANFFKTLLCSNGKCNHDNKLINCPTQCESPKDKHTAKICKDMGCGIESKITKDDTISLENAYIQHENISKDRVQDMLYNNGGQIGNNSPGYCPASCESTTDNRKVQLCQLIGCKPEEDSDQVHKQSECPDSCTSPRNDSIKNACVHLGCIANGTAQDNLNPIGAQPQNNNLDYCPASCKSPTDDIRAKICLEMGCKPEVTSNPEGQVHKPNECPDSCTSPPNDLMKIACATIGCIPKGTPQDILNPNSAQKLNDTTSKCPASCKSPTDDIRAKVCLETGCNPEVTSSPEGKVHKPNEFINQEPKDSIPVQPNPNVTDHESQVSKDSTSNPTNSETSATKTPTITEFLTRSKPNSSVSDDEAQEPRDSIPVLSNPNVTDHESLVSNDSTLNPTKPETSETERSTITEVLKPVDVKPNVTEHEEILYPFSKI